MSRVLKAMVAALMALLLLSACGDDDDTDGSDAATDVDAGTDDGETPSDDVEDSSEDEDSEFVQRAEAFCSETAEKGDTEFREYVEEHPEFAEADTFDDVPQEIQDELARIVLDVFGELVDNLRSIEPDGRADEWSALLDEFDDAVRQFADDPGAAFEGDPFAEVTEQLADFGLEGCGA